MVTTKEKRSDMEIQTTIRELPQRIKHLNISPETSIRIIIDELKDEKKPVEESKWAKVAKKISEESPLRGHGETLRKASREFRDNFSFREPPHFTSNENE